MVVVEAEHQLPARAAVVERDAAEGEIAGFERALPFEHEEERLDDRAAPRVHRRRSAERIDQPAHREILVRIGGEGGLAHPPEQLAEGGIAGQVHGERDLGEEEAEGPFQLLARAVGAVRADDDLLLVGEAEEEGVEDAEEGHEHGQPLLPRQGAQALGALAAGADAVEAAALVRHLRPGVIGRQVEDEREARQLLLPERRLARLHRAPQPLALPQDVVRVLRRDGRQHGLAPGVAGVVEGDQLAPAELEGDPVGGQVVDADQAEVLLRAEAGEADAHQRPAFEIERGARPLGEGVVGGGLAHLGRQGRQVHQ